MEIEIRIFGSLVDDLGAEKITLDNVHDSDDLLSMLYFKYPSLEAKKFMIAVDKKIIHSKTELNSTSEIALLPPFSGG